jgi:hypothetical protein
MHAESPELLQDRLALLQRELEGAEGAYRLAVAQDAEWVDRQKIKFLRAEDFNASAAAARMLRYFTLKETLFGAEKLGRDIRLEDFNQDDMESLRAGGLQILSEPDHAGRRIFFTQNRNYVYKDRKNMVSVFVLFLDYKVQVQCIGRVVIICEVMIGFILLHHSQSPVLSLTHRHFRHHGCYNCHVSCFSCVICHVLCVISAACFFLLFAVRYSGREIPKSWIFECVL